jgi:hypothetical protein
MSGYPLTARPPRLPYDTRMHRLFHVVPNLYDHHIVDTGREPQFFVLLSFLLTFVVVRTIAHTIRSGRTIHLVRNVKAGQTHIHHLVPGIILLLVAGYLGVAIDRSRLDIVAIVFGIGAALTLDEFALWLHLRDVYWEREGRTSVDAVIVTATILGIFVIGGQFFLEVAKQLLSEIPP